MPNLPKPNESAKRYVARNWVEIAINAYIYFREYGRGVSFYDFTGEVPEVFDYKTEDIVIQAAQMDSGFVSVLRDVKEYDPDNEVIVAVRTKNEEVVLRTGPPLELCLNPQKPPTPARLYEAHMAKKSKAASQKQPNFKSPQYLPGENPAQFLVRNWDIIAANAYLNYKLQGKGSINYYFTPGNKNPQGYSPEKNVAKMTTSPFFRKLLTEIKLYNPEEEVVLVLATPQGQLGVCKGKPPGEHLSPPELYKMIMEKAKNQAH